MCGNKYTTFIQKERRYHEKDSRYYFSVNGHNWEIVKNNDGTHTKSCDICGDVFTYSCSLRYVATENNQHYRYCTVCDYITSRQSYTLVITGNGDQTHTKQCAYCSNGTVYDCELVSTYLGSGAHQSTCNICDYSFFASCTRVPTYCGDDTLGDVHISACEECGDSTGATTTACTFVYEFAGRVNGVYTHNRVCEDCGYVKAQNVNCLYKNGETCAFCGHEKPLTGVVSTPPTTVTE